MPMQHNAVKTGDYDSPLGRILLAADGAGLTGLWFYGQKRFPCAAGGARLSLSAGAEGTAASAIEQAKHWLDIYFSGRAPDVSVPLHLAGSKLQREVWELLLGIPYGATATYGELASRIAARRRRFVSAQAVGGAVGRNPVSIIVPCHRVIGSRGDLTGYAGGLERKARLLALEGAHVSPKPRRRR